MNLSEDDILFWIWMWREIRFLMDVWMLAIRMLTDGIDGYHDPFADSSQANNGSGIVNTPIADRENVENNAKVSV
jgi:hypothetical protein